MEAFKIATVGSHSALQILKGAKDEGFQTIAICTQDKVDVYKSFGVADDIIVLQNWDNFGGIEKELKKRNAIIIPHGSFVQFMTPEKCEKLTVSYYGNKRILKWESDREKEREWLEKAGLQIPKQLSSPSEIDRSVIVKFHGALGGDGYFIARNEHDFHAKLAQSPHKEKRYVIQEYIIGVPIYIHYFYSSMTGELEVMSFDRRYETNVDAIGRIPGKDQGNISPSYVVVGNTPLVIRESLLPIIFEMGKQVIAASKQLDPVGLFGPFCLETILTPQQKFIVFEISARIVAGTNLFINGSPYTDVKYGKPMSTGRRIALDITQAIERNELHRVLH